MPYLLQNNINNNLTLQNNKSNPNPNPSPNLNPNSSQILSTNIANILNNSNSSVNSNSTSSLSSRASSFNFNSLLLQNALGINPSLSMPQFPSQPLGIPTPGQGIVSTPAQAPTTKKVQVELPDPHFYVYNEENKTIDETEKILEKSYNDFESLLENKKNKFSILIKFIHEGTYQIKFIVTYSLKRKDIDDFYELSQENILNFEVVEPFHCTHEIDSSNFLTIPQESSEKKTKKLTAYLTNRDIYINLILKNKLHENINIRNIEIELDKDKLKDENKNIQINSNIFEVMNLKELDQNIKDDILTILSTAEYCIPFETKFYDEFKGRIGKIKIKWTTPSLKEFEKEIGDTNNNLTLINENIFEFPNIIINKLELNYDYETNINDKKEIILNIKVENNTKKFKKLIFFIETGDEINFIISGKVKQSKMIKSDETVKFIYKLIPLQSGELKLPSLKIWEINVNNNIQDRICSHYYFPQKIKVI